MVTIFQGREKKVQNNYLTAVTQNEKQNKLIHFLNGQYVAHRHCLPKTWLNTSANTWSVCRLVSRYSLVQPNSHWWNNH